jgi:hypothetical protein
MTARWSGVFSGDAETRSGEDLEVERWRVHLRVDLSALGGQPPKRNVSTGARDEKRRL